MWKDGKYMNSDICWVDMKREQSIFIFKGEINQPITDELPS